METLKKCNISNHTQLIDTLLKDNSVILEQNKQMVELVKNAGNNNNNFNLNFFLNETCKNAMNIMKFVSIWKTWIY